MERHSVRLSDQADTLVASASVGWRECEQRFGKIFEEGPLAMALVSRDYRLLDVNCRLCDLLGYTWAELTRLGFPDITHPEDIAKGIELAERVFRGEIPFYQIEKRYVTKAQEIVWVNLTASAVRNEAGEPVYALAMIEDITERKRAEETLVRSERKYHRLVDNISDALIIDDREGRVVFANNRFLEMLGLSRADLSSFVLEDYVAPEWQAKLRDRHDRRVRGEDVPQRFEYEGVKKDGTRLWLETAVVSVVENGRSVGTQSTIRDITERVRAENALRSIVEEVASATGQEFFQRLVRHLAEALEVKFAFVSELVDPGGERLRLSSFWTGRDYGENSEYAAEGTPCGEALRTGLVFYPARVQEHFPDFALLREAGIDSVMAIPLFNSAGKACGTLSVMHDGPMEERYSAESILRIFAARAGAELERKRTNQQLYKSESKYKYLIQQSPDPIFVSRIDNFVFTEVNDRACENYGYSREDFLSMNIFDIEVEAPLRQQVRAFYDEIDVGQVVEVNGTSRRKDGSTFPVQARFTKLDDELALAVVRDVSERKRAEDEVQKSRERLRNLAARLHAVREDERTMIAREIHDELGQALTSLKIDLYWVMGKLPKSPSTLLERGRSMASLLDSTLDRVRRLSSRIRPAMLDDLGLGAAIEWQVQEFASRTDCKCEVDLEVGELGFDRDRDTAVFRILQEALTNVARHAEARRVEISMRATDGALVLEVRDDGIGITDDQVASMQSLGLIGMRERAGALGGRVHIRRLAEGAEAGTVVGLRMPLTANTDSGALL